MRYHILLHLQVIILRNETLTVSTNPFPFIVLEYLTGFVLYLALWYNVLLMLMQLLLLKERAIVFSISVFSTVCLVCPPSGIFKDTFWIPGFESLKKTIECVNIVSTNLFSFLGNTSSFKWLFFIAYVWLIVIRWQTQNNF